MNKHLGSIALGLAVVALVLGVVSYQKQPTVLKGASGAQGPQGIQGPVGPVGPQGPRGERGPAGESGQVKLGAMPGSDLYSPTFSVNGVRSFFTRQNLAQATTTVCAIQAPTTGTSSLRFFSIKESTSTTTASIIDIAKASTAFATTTKLVPTQSLGANAVWGFGLTGTSTVGTNYQPLSFAAGEWVVVNQVGGAGLAVSPVGVCQAEFTDF